MSIIQQLAPMADIRGEEIGPPFSIYSCIQPDGSNSFVMASSWAYPNSSVICTCFTKASRRK
jgi:hypothetical protein